MLIQYIMNPWYMLFVFTIFLKLTTLGTYEPSFGSLCTVTFLAKRERVPANTIPTAGTEACPDVTGAGGRSICGGMASNKKTAESARSSCPFPIKEL